MLTLRSATLLDVPAVVALVEAAYRGSDRSGWTTEADLIDGKRTDSSEVLVALRDEGSTVLVAERDEQIVACAHLKVDGTTGLFGMFAVWPSLQGAGVGKSVLAEAERLARSQGVALLEMHVLDVRADLVAFYERRGYRRTGTKLRFPYGEPRFGVPRRANLQFEVLEKRL